jgi:hypothetical protein
MSRPNLKKKTRPKVNWPGNRLPLGFRFNSARGDKHTPTDFLRYQVTVMAAIGIRRDTMCSILGISEPTLDKYYRKEYEAGKDQANALVASRLWETAVFGLGKEHVTAAIFWLKTQARWKETVANELSGPNGTPIPIEETNRLTDEERANRLLQILNAAAAGGPGQADPVRSTRLASKSRSSD